MKKALLLGLSALLGATSLGGITLYKALAPKDGVVVGTMSDEEADFVRNNPLKPCYAPTDEYYKSKQYVSMNHVGDIETVWDSYRGAGTKIAVIDSGINYKHPDFYNADGTSKISDQSKYFYVSGNSVLKKTAATNGYDVLLHDWDSEYSEWNAHGSNVAGSAAAATGNTTGTIGIAPEATILAYKTDFYLSSISYAIQDAISQGADVINMSLGAYAETFTDGYGDEQSGSASVATYLENIIKSAHNAGIIVIAAAGNEKTDHHSYPACNTYVIGVGALNNNSSTTKAAFSNYNYSTETTSEGNHNVDIMAPGYVYAPNMGGTESSPTYTDYCNTQGTSFASPIVAGAAALWKQKYPAGTPDEFEEQLYSSAVDIGTKGFDSTFGNGRLDVKALLDYDSGDRVSLSDTSITVNAGMSKTISVKSASGTISWSSDNTNIATVDSTGKVTGVAAGTTTVRAKVGEAEATVSVTVNAYVAATSIQLNPTEYTIAEGDVYQINATVLPADASDKTILYESLDETVATVDDDGKVTGVKEGDADIYMIGADDTEATFTIHVEKATSIVYQKVTSALTSYAGDYLFVYENSGVAFDGSLSALDASQNTIPVTISSSSITSSSTIEASKFVVSSSATSGKYYVKSSSGKYIYGSSSSNTISTATTASSACDNEFSFTSGKPVVKAGGYLCFNASSGQERFRYMKTNANNLAIYKKSTGTPDKVLDSILVSYTGGDVVIGNELDESKISVTAHYTVPTVYPDEAISSGYTVSGFSSETVGTKTVTVSYGGKNASFDVEVVYDPSAVLTGITVTGVPTSSIYRKAFDASSVVVTAHYDKKPDQIVTSDVTLPTVDTCHVGPFDYEVSFTDGGVTKSASVSSKITLQGAAPTITETSVRFDLVTSADDIAVGDTVVIAASASNYALSTTQNSNNRGQAAITKNTSAKTMLPGSPDTVQRLTLCAGSSTGTYAFSTGSGYLAAASSSSNYLKTVAAIDGNSSWAISIASGGATTITAQGSYTRKILKYNSSNSVFSCYSSGQAAVVLYKDNSTAAGQDWYGVDEAKDFATYFLEKTAAGCASKTEADITAVWADLSDEFGYMIAEAKTAFGNSEDATITEARERYKILVAKYGSLSPFAASSLSLLRQGGSGADEKAAPIIALSFAGIACLTGLCFLKKKRD